MKNHISVVIICLNAADTIQKAILSLEDLTSDVIVADSGSTDATIELLAATNVTLIHLNWIGYGANKNAAGANAKNDWLLSLDADEYVDQHFISLIQELDLTDQNKIYQFRRQNFLGSKAIRYGEWSKDKVARLFNRQVVAWDDSPVHEQLTGKPGTELVKINAAICHRTAPNINSYNKKIQQYATLMAHKYFSQQKKISWIKIYASPIFNFIQNYIFRLGILDGKEGFQIARAHAGYTFKKYYQLQELYKANS